MFEESCRQVVWRQKNICNNCLPTMSLNAREQLVLSPNINMRNAGFEALKIKMLSIWVLPYRWKIWRFSVKMSLRKSKEQEKLIAWVEAKAECFPLRICLSRSQPFLYALFATSLFVWGSEAIIRDCPDVTGLYRYRYYHYLQEGIR